MSKAAATRLNILKKSFDLIYKKGYQATSIDDILSTMEVTKGAFFYHFKNKEEMGLALIREVMRPEMRDILFQPLTRAEDPLSEIYEMIGNLLQDQSFFDFRYGCPAINLIQEMAPTNEDFKKELTSLMKDWQGVVKNSLEKGIAMNKVHAGVDPAQASLFIISGYAGIRSMGKIFGPQMYSAYLKELKTYLDQLRSA
ncbi:TetR/AcrR family transcriptional regulator [Pedobacter nutrimenti]|uniref:TetR family transcriptional regulator n=1 Tax=Pedobacter nutrimenti TaxID=1241337 RepID=A0A318UD28_9SPHI|nr:TetR/AcrR family transcriptional regulator [Pedobacter nutrimenti]PYF74306.1 TetR family transcriptional regulator [Pedobacter nutrimenti]